MSVSELNEQVKTALERGFASVWVEAEIVNFTAANSGHWYFTLHDGDSQLRAACYVRNNLRIRFEPFDGLQVRVRGKLSVYQPKGEYQILVESLQPVGEGALHRHTNLPRMVGSLFGGFTEVMVGLAGWA